MNRLSVADIDAEADAGAAGAALRHDLHAPIAVESAAHGGRTGRSKRHGGQRRDRRDGDDGIAIQAWGPSRDGCVHLNAACPLGYSVGQSHSKVHGPQTKLNGTPLMGPASGVTRSRCASCPPSRLIHPPAWRSLRPKSVITNGNRPLAHATRKGGHPWTPSNGAPCSKARDSARSPSRWAAPGVDDAGGSVCAGRAAPHCSSPRRPRPSRRWARRWCRARAQAGVVAFHRPAGVGHGRRGAARGAPAQRQAALRELLSRRDRRHRQGASEARSGQPFAALDAAAQRDFVDQMRQNKIEGWKGRPAGSSISSCAATRSTSSTAPWTATSRSTSPTWPHIAPKRRW